MNEFTIWIAINNTIGFTRCRTAMDPPSPGVNAFEALPLSGSVLIRGSFAEGHVKADSTYRTLF
ncbi:hypothetical protein QF026_004823 [Streptomyces aurantiacus]|uniref:hypothetical protein n=1 Tax=Streptomyces aurantiacus TaxID=47760 RepID=UPI002793AFCF|nr:hypothetical protein [Streptomyces aurantiacus]MDQ0776357.1 hypothetical protein [Streptomyces aurantiacus]